MDLIDVQALSKSFGGVVALNAANFSAHAGEVHALLGENGAGKSTFIQILSGVLRRDAGTIHVDGAHFRPGNPDAAQALGIAAVFQELSLIADLNVEDNIWFRHEPLTRIGTVNRKRMRADTRALFEHYRFPAIRPDRALRQLTLAERQIVEIAKALAKKPRILILDEATSALAAHETKWLLALSRQIAEEGRLVIFISHRMGEVRAVADRLTIFRNGQTVATHEVNAVSDDQVVTEMIGRQLGQLYPERVPTRTRQVALAARALSSGARLRGVTFDLHEGEVLGVGGLQGHGQSELFQALFGTAVAHGALTLWGRPVALAKPRRMLIGADGIALVPEDRRSQGLLLAKSVRENLTLAAIRRFSRGGLLNRNRETRLVREMVEFLHIKASSLEQEIDTLSGGNQQKVVLGKMLLTQARVLLLYDPTRGIDVGTKREIFQIIRHLAAQGYAILFYSSDLQELVHLADNVLVLREGRVACTLSGAAISEEAILGAAVLEGAA